MKQAATGGDPIGTLFVNPGGPGASGANYVRNNIDGAVGTALQRDYDVIGWDPRGVGASSAVNCFDDAEMDEFLFGIDDDSVDLERGSAEWIAAATEESTAFGAACQENTGPLLGYVDTNSTVRDLDMLREIAGDEQLHYLGYSYGTFIGARYAETYPERVGRMVLDGVLSPSATLADVVREQTRGFESALRSYAAWCLSGEDCPLSGSVVGGSATGKSASVEAAVDAAMTRIRSVLEAVDDEPIRATDGRLLGSSTLLTAIITPLYSQSNWGYLNTLFASVAEGDADFAFALADSYYGRVDGTYEDNSTVAFSAINCLDYPRDADPERMKREAAELEQLAPTIGKFQGYGDLSCAGWPYPGVESRDKVTARGSDPILVLGTTGDPATPYQWAVDLAENLENGVLVSLEGEGHTAYGKNSCVDRVVESYLLDGTTPENGLVCR
ncbi:alpha/beta hydrolase [Leucobacter denitrificans]|uniref:alpha/beta hydrolase n=1 Tax=Leucobacter denitrificans TaxID=683042 RepID=UPI001FE63BAA|nr:alpha/beta hydrolase [Leucobacter denitrificans]